MNARTITLVAQRWCRGRGPAPSYAVQRAMIGSIGAAWHAQGGGGAPFALLLRSWRRPVQVDPAAGDFLARMMVDLDPAAAADRSLASWVQWQHAKWVWSWEPFPVMESVSVL